MVAWMKLNIKCRSSVQNLLKKKQITDDAITPEDEGDLNLYVILKIQFFKSLNYDFSIKNHYFFSFWVYLQSMRFLYREENNVSTRGDTDTHVNDSITKKTFIKILDEIQVPNLGLEAALQVCKKTNRQYASKPSKAKPVSSYATKECKHNNYSFQTSSSINSSCFIWLI